jgi:hypothetical protein
MLLPLEASQVAARLVREISRVRQERKVFKLSLRKIASLLGCRQASVFLHRRATGSLYKATSLSEKETWDTRLLESFYQNERPLLPGDVIMAPVRAGELVTGVMALRKPGGFARGDGKTVTEILRIAGGELGLRRRLSLCTSRARIGEAILEGVGAKNVAYRVLHQLRRFIDYDHGATVVARLDEGRGAGGRAGQGRVVARQVAWTAGKSGIVGAGAAVAWDASHEEVGILPEIAGAGPAGPITVPDSGAPAKQSVLLGWLARRDRALGCVELASTRPGFFVDNDIPILRGFLPYLRWCIEELVADPGGRDE